MKISGFSFCRNAEKLYYPVGESIRSALPLVDEFVVAVGRGDDDDATRETITAIGDPKIKIVDTEWTDRDRLRGSVHGQQTNIALEHCTGDWCLYLQADEVLHEDDLATISRRCEALHTDDRVEGLAFRYNHFWGDYNHVHRSHAWYPEEIRIIRNQKGIRSHGSAQSFRKAGRRLVCSRVDAAIYHYGWARPPHLMRTKTYELACTHEGEERARAHLRTEGYHYGCLADIPLFEGTHPKVMRDWVARFDWADQLQYEGPAEVMHRHDKVKYKALTWLEKTFLNGRRLGVQPWRRMLRC